MFATNNDLLDLLPAVFDHGVEDWTVELNRAEEDILRKIQAEWYNKRYNNDNWDPANLVESQWTQATLYRALSNYIMPRLTQWRTDGDAFQTQIKFYQDKFAEEIADQFAIGIQYDYNEDGNIDESEEYYNQQDRLWR